jgi:hypothetical protein
VCCGIVGIRLVLPEAAVDDEEYAPPCKNNAFDISAAIPGRRSANDDADDDDNGYGEDGICKVVLLGEDLLLRGFVVAAVSCMDRRSVSGLFHIGTDSSIVVLKFVRNN